MQVIYRISEFKDKFKRNILSIGVFDGVHIGHQDLLTRLVSRAKEKKMRSIVFTFYPNPDSQFLIYPIFHRLKLLKDYGVDLCVVVRFSKNLCKLEPADFISKYILEKIQPEEIIVGENFRFGKDGKGDVNLLLHYAKRFNFRINSLPLKKIDSKIVSSTRIRKLIKDGDLERMKRLLNRDYSIIGRVIVGRSLGKKLGYPTANISTFVPCNLASGIYCVEVINRDKKFLGVCYIGSRPTLLPCSCVQRGRAKNKLRYIETHLFNLRRNIYGRTLEIRFIKKIRDEKRFNSVEQLKINIKRDIQKAKIFFHNLYHNISPTNFL